MIFSRYDIEHFLLIVQYYIEKQHLKDLLTFCIVDIAAAPALNPVHFIVRGRQLQLRFASLIFVLLLFLNIF